MIVAVKGDLILPLTINGVEYRGHRFGSGWLVGAYGPGRSRIIGEGFAAMPDDAVRAARADVRDLRDDLNAADLDDPCDCGAVLGADHDCDPATVRMDGDEMHGLEAEVMP